jgi:serine phosphatase RsbU (regulator of sigma subunit)
MIGNAFLNQVVNEKGCTNPAEILNQLRELIIDSLKQTGTVGENKDGMDISILSFDEQKGVVEFAGANNPLWILSKDSSTENPDIPVIKEIKGDKQPIGIYSGNPTPFTNHEIKFNKGESYYIFTDGFADQMGGTTGKKFRYKTLKEFLISINGKSMKEQEEIMLKTLIEWKGMLDQTDDILVIGIRV